MLRRHPSTAFGSVHVFPGGVVDAADHDTGARRRAAPGLDDADASAQLGVAERRPGVLGRGRARGLRGGRRAPRPHARRATPCASTTTPTSEARFDEHRRALHAGERSLLDVLAAEDLTLALDDVRYFAHWITPEGEPKRFDTRFFLARAPEGQAYAHDDGELIGSEWVRPADALAPPPGRRLRHDRPHHREPPGHRSLRHLRRAAVVQRARHARAPTGDPRDRRRRPRGPRTAEPIVPGVASALSPLVRRIVANNPGRMTGPGTNTYLVGIDEIVVIDPGPDDAGHLDAIAGCGGDRIRWIVCTHTHIDHFPGVAGLKERTGAEVLAFDARDGLEIDRPLARRRPHRGHRVRAPRRPHARATRRTTSATCSSRSACSSPATTSWRAPPSSSARPTATWPPTSSSSSG